MTLLQTKLNSKGGVTLDASEYVTLQDDFGRMTLEQTGKMWATLDMRQRDTFMFLAYRVLSTDVAIEMIKRLVLADTVAEEVNRRVAEVIRENKQMESRLLVLPVLEVELETARRRVANAESELAEAKRYIRLQDEELDQLREVAAALNTLRKFLA